jgi:hypothetical protein
VARGLAAARPIGLRRNCSIVIRGMSGASVNSLGPVTPLRLLDQGEACQPSDRKERAAAKQQRPAPDQYVEKPLTHGASGPPRALSAVNSPTRIP